MSKFDDYNFSGGKGTRDNPYLISNAQELYNIKYTGSKVLGSAICMNKSI